MHTSKVELENVHSDIWGQSQPSLMNGGRYFITIKEAMVCILKEKSDAFKLFKEWHAMVEREKGVSLKCLRTVKGLEYLSSELMNIVRAKASRDIEQLQ